MRTNLFDHVNIDQSGCNIPNGMNPTPKMSVPGTTP